MYVCMYVCMWLCVYRLGEVDDNILQYFLAIVSCLVVFIIVVHRLIYSTILYSYINIHSMYSTNMHTFIRT